MLMQLINILSWLHIIFNLVYIYVAHKELNSNQELIRWLLSRNIDKTEQYMLFHRKALLIKKNTVFICVYLLNTHLK